ncbi:DUF1540 domain-containing protein [Mycoplasmatota bacterium WC44]
MPNSSIGCNVNECKYHSKSVNQCDLTRIEVTKHGDSATSVESTDCASFVKE